MPTGPYASADLVRVSSNYLAELEREGERLSAELSRVTVERDALKRTALHFQARVNDLEAEQADVTEMCIERDAAFAMADHANADLDELAELRAEVERLTAELASVTEERDQLELALRPCRYAQALDDISRQGQRSDGEVSP